MHAGERSLIFLGGQYSHAVRKVPADGDFRVQTQLRRAEPAAHEATAAELAAAQRRRWTGSTAELLYARVDWSAPRIPLVMELELIEPELFLPMARARPGRLADAILARL